MFDRFSPPANDILSMSAGFEYLLIHADFHSSLAVTSRTKWNAIEDDLFFNLEWGLEVLYITDWLSPSMKVGNSIDILIIRSF